MAPNGLGLAQAGLWKTLLSTRTQTLFIAKFNLFCPTKQRRQAGKLSHGQKNLEKPRLPPLPCVSGWPLHAVFLSASACYITCQT